MKFVWKIVLSRMKRQKIRLLFIVLAIAASSCLLVWTIGGFNALFLDASNDASDYLGHYDLRISAPTLDPIAASRDGRSFSPMRAVKRGTGQKSRRNRCGWSGDRASCWTGEGVLDAYHNADRLLDEGPRICKKRSKFADTRRERGQA